ncbi:hypothetical protein [Candidatus Bathycorpusculum sp.]|uniref:hypothetical protein n=1 Tax=Candidatus Bathycorpusculum sp. TaxID=2994959 RepID=UPI0028258E57|nr:hypothetical protein [Candidatus Termitimicrobium sp.]
MAGFDFVNRETELEGIKECLNSNSAVFLDSLGNSGLTHFLKKLYYDYCAENAYCFYIDGEQNRSLQEQMLYQIFEASKREDKSRKRMWQKPRKQMGKNIKEVIKICAYGIDIIPCLPNIGDLVNSFINAIETTLDADEYHIKDYKIEQALTKLFKTIDKPIYVLIDRTDLLIKESYQFLATMLKDCNAKILFTFSNSDAEKEIKIVSQLSLGGIKHFKQETVFDRPDKNMIVELFKHYEKALNDDLMKYICDRHRKIHIIMAKINGCDIYLSGIDEKKGYLLKILAVLNVPIEAKLLERIYEKHPVYALNFLHSEFEALLDELIQKKALCIKNNEVELAEIVDYCSSIEISNLDRIIITNDIIATFLQAKEQLNISQLKFAIANTTKDYSKKKAFIMALLCQQKKS